MSLINALLEVGNHCCRPLDDTMTPFLQPKWQAALVLYVYLRQTAV